MDPDTLTQKSYLGDGVYIGFDGYLFWIYTAIGIGGTDVTNAVALEPQVLAAFETYIKNLHTN